MAFKIDFPVERIESVGEKNGSIVEKVTVTEIVQLKPCTLRKQNLLKYFFFFWHTVAGILCGRVDAM